jgi:hypothetical protein
VQVRTFWRIEEIEKEDRQKKKYKKEGNARRKEG